MQAAEPLPTVCERLAILSTPSQAMGAELGVVNNTPTGNGFKGHLLVLTAGMDDFLTKWLVVAAAVKA